MSVYNKLSPHVPSDMSSCTLDVNSGLYGAPSSGTMVQHAPAQLLDVTQRTCRRTHMQLSEGGMLPEREMERGRPPTEGLLCNTGSLLLLLLIGTATVFSFSPPT
jgi:hypothetical protein